MSMVSLSARERRTAIPPPQPSPTFSNSPTRQPAHPQNPVEPLMTLISAFTTPGQVVLGPFCGSDSTVAPRRSRSAGGSASISAPCTARPPQSSADCRGLPRSSGLILLFPKIHASPVDRRISCDADNALPCVWLLSVLPRFPNLTRSWPAGRSRQRRCPLHSSLRSSRVGRFPSVTAPFLPSCPISDRVTGNAERTIPCRTLKGRTFTHASPRKSSLLSNSG